MERRLSTWSNASRVRPDGEPCAFDSSKHPKPRGKARRVTRSMMELTRTPSVPAATPRQFQAPSRVVSLPPVVALRRPVTGSAMRAIGSRL